MTDAFDRAQALCRIRRFNRAVVAEIGALDASFLGRGRPLGEARMIHAIGRGDPEAGREVAEIRAELRLDSGLASRLLRSLEAQGLAEVRRHPDDGRRRVARLTAAGRAENTAYDRLSDRRAGALIERHGRRGGAALLEAMDRVACALGADRIAIKRVDPASDAALSCLERYYDELARRFPKGFEVSLSRDPQAGDMRPPRGAFLVASLEGMPLACAGLKGGEDFAEVKRVWVAPAARGLGLASRMMEAVEAEARALGIPLLRLDTNRALPEAASLYRRLGWAEIARFNDDPYAELFFEKRLEPAAPQAGRIAPGVGRR
ncbi:bifunctional helix-turn-helix transcriptional regulator/GNAT family N-acetyltransferase [Albimonas sp. CAU 1670]|uniref:bifunctional helix-turn-helix transcriptional regulator/GNAT family N-acetyltransferase n=1 Tax=Albimonas sp. CAU 1670 TaxID=3032599 RepID=UPI0023DA4C87|nr:bifunctional helix-turn-helix transcriptional regulator/GNAT family N-acetyltransferase [Albimonas sp. CAU 1670]MDF2231863.1 bifunctional helix-turn-helix transcriptional regulator/GNAT family N-acetyltransferase [Albimonas sp. CAU 1670]